MNRGLQGAQVPDWMAKGNTTLMLNDPIKGTAPNNYRPITCLPIIGIVYQKANDMVPQSWIIQCLKIYKISHEIINFIEKTMQTRRVELTVVERRLAETKTQKGILRKCTITFIIHNNYDAT